MIVNASLDTVCPKRKRAMNDIKIFNCYNLITVVAITILFCLVVCFQVMLNRAFYHLTSWQKSWAVIDSIKLYHRENKCYPENWVDIVATYERSGLETGYSWPPESLDVEIDVNFGLMSFLNDGDMGIDQVSKENRWIVKMKKYRIAIFEEEFFDSFFAYHSKTISTDCLPCGNGGPEDKTEIE
jgi:hypothetical protein